jgi:hypothetical protein
MIDIEDGIKITLRLRQLSIAPYAISWTVSGK